MIEECPHCIDDEGYAIQLDHDGTCPVCGENFSEYD